MGGGPWSDRVGSGSPGSQGRWRQWFPGPGAGTPAEIRGTRASCLPCVATNCKPLCRHGATSLGRASKGQKWEDSSGQEEHGSPPGQPLKLGGLKLSHLEIKKQTEAGTQAG